MSEKKSKATKTITFRLDADKVDRINELADERNMSLREFILSQLDANSPMGILLFGEREKVLLGSAYAVKQAFDFISGLTTIRQESNLSEEEFSNKLVESFNSLITNK